MKPIEFGAKIKYLGKQFLLKRGDNDSFLTHGRVHRLGIAINGCRKIAKRIYNDSDLESYCIRKVIRNEISFKSMMFVKLWTARNPKSESMIQLKGIIASKNLFIVNPIWLLGVIHSTILHTRNSFRSLKQILV